MKTYFQLPMIVGLLFIFSTAAYADTKAYAVKLPKPKDGEYIHKSPSIDDLLVDKKINPKLKSVILKGYDLFMNTQQLRGKHVFNDMSCSNCHLGGGSLMYSGPVWPATTQLPAYRGKNKHVNNFAERIAGCFTYSMNGIPPAYGSDTMVALEAWHYWLATGAPVFNDKKIAGRGYRSVKEPKLKGDYARGEAVYKQHCAICHGNDGQGKKSQNKPIFPPLWGKYSYNWGAGMARIFTAASFIKWNMPLGQPGLLSDQQAWDVAYFINAHERPQDPRFTGNVEETRIKFKHNHSLYGQKINGQILGQKTDKGEKPVLKPKTLIHRTFKEGSDKLMQP